MNFFIFLLISLCNIWNISCTNINLTVSGGITAYIVNGNVARNVERHTKLYETTDPSSFEIKHIKKLAKFLSPKDFVNYTKQFLNNTLSGAMSLIKNGSEYYNTLSQTLTPSMKNNKLFQLFNVTFVSMSRKGSDNIVEENKEVLYNIVDSCRDIIRNSVLEMKPKERKSVLSKVNDFTQAQYDKICKEFNYCRTIYEWTRLGKEITINVGRMQTKKLIEFYTDLYTFYLGVLNVSGIMSTEQEDLMRNKTVNLYKEPGYSLRHLSHYATGIFDKNVTKYRNFTVHIDSMELDRVTYDEWDNLNEDLMAWGKDLSNDLRVLLARMALLTQIFIDSWKPDIVAYIKDDMVEIFKPEDLTL